MAERRGCNVDRSLSDLANCERSPAKTPTVKELAWQRLTRPVCGCSHAVQARLIAGDRVGAVFASSSRRAPRVPLSLTTNLLLNLPQPRLLPHPFNPIRCVGLGWGLRRRSLLKILHAYQPRSVAENVVDPALLPLVPAPSKPFTVTTSSPGLGLALEQQCVATFCSPLRGDHRVPCLPLIPPRRTLAGRRGRGERGRVFRSRDLLPPTVSLPSAPGPT